MNTQLSFAATFTQLAICLSVGVALSLGLSAKVTAQIGQQTPDTEQSNEYDSNNTGTLGNSFNPLDLIHQMRLRPTRDGSQFNQDSQQNLIDAASEFKRQRQESLNQQTPSQQPWEAGLKDM